MNSTIENLISKYTNYHHFDMFFNSVYSFMLCRTDEYSNGYFDEGMLTDRKLLYQKYRKLSAYILHDACKIKIPDYDEIEDTEKFELKTTYSDIISYCELYFNCIPQQVNNSDAEKKLILKEFNDNSNFSIFTQQCIYKGYIQAIKRILHNIENEELFGYEYYEKGEYDQLIIYPTPKGMLMKRVLLNMYNDKRNKFEETLNDFFAKNDIIRIKKKEIEEKYDCKYIFLDKKKKKVFGYLPRKIENIYMEHGEQNRNNAIAALLNQTQINLSFIANVK